MKTIIKKHKHLSKDGSKSVVSLDIKELPDDVCEQVMRLIEGQCSYELIESDDTKPTNYPYQPHQCKMTGVHLTRRREDNGRCAFCGGE